MKKVKYIEVGDGYECVEPYTYYSKRYDKNITVRRGFYSDGATFAIDIDSDCWWIHDVLCRYGIFDDGSKCTNHQASVILRDIMISDGFPVLRANYWYALTLLHGGGAARDNGIFKLKEHR